MPAAAQGAPVGVLARLVPAPHVPAEEAGGAQRVLTRRLHQLRHLPLERRHRLLVHRLGLRRRHSTTAQVQGAPPRRTRRWATSSAIATGSDVSRLPSIVLSCLIASGTRSAGRKRGDPSCASGAGGQGRTRHEHREAGPEVHGGIVPEELEPLLRRRSDVVILPPPPIVVDPNLPPRERGGAGRRAVRRGAATGGTGRWRGAGVVVRG